jgi:DNA-binding NarL/FixJ family response regulator
MQQVPLLLVTSRLALRSLFDSPPERDFPAFAVSHLPLDRATVENSLDQLPLLAVAVVDFVPDPIVATRVCRLLCERAQPVPVLALVCCPQTLTTQQVASLADCGAQGLLDLSGPRPSIIQAVQNVLHGELLIHVEAATQRAALFRQLGPAQDRPRRQLTARERAVLQRLADGLSREQIAEAEHLGMRSVTRTLSGLQQKLDAPSLFVLGKKATQLGYVF